MDIKCIYTIGLLMLVPLTYGKYEPMSLSKVELQATKRNNQKKLSKLDLRKTISGGKATLKSLPKITREALMAQMLGLLFKEDDDYTPYIIDKKSKSYNFLLYEASGKAQFVDSEGKVRYYSQATTLPNSKIEWPGCITLCVAKYGTDTIFGDYADDIQKMCCNTIKHKMKDIPAITKLAWLAETAGLMYTKGSEPVYNENKHLCIGGSLFMIRSLYSGVLCNRIWRYGGYDTLDQHHSIRWFIYKEAQPNAFFLDTEGKEHTKKEAWNEMEEKAEKTMELLLWCASLIGGEDVLALYPKEVEALREQHDKAENR